MADILVGIVVGEPGKGAHQLRLDRHHAAWLHWHGEGVPNLVEVRRPDADVPKGLLGMAENVSRDGLDRKMFQNVSVARLEEKPSLIDFKFLRNKLASPEVGSL
jgi:hypothetical protein